MARRKPVPRINLPGLKAGKVKDCLDKVLVDECARELDTALWRNTKKIMEAKGDKKTTELSMIEDRTLRRAQAAISKYELRVVPDKPAGQKKKKAAKKAKPQEETETMDEKVD